jgi:membrane-associated protein
MILLTDFHWSDLLQPQFYIDNGGLWVMLFIIFAETGLFVGFFLPGDSLLFVAGIFSNKLAAYLYDAGNDFVNLLMLIVLVSTAGILGNFVGYWFGKKSGPFLFHKKDTWFFKKKHLYHAKDFYDRHGGGAIVFARFLPIVRTFAPIVAGIVAMNARKFALFNCIGSFAWAATMLSAGHYLDKFFIEQYNFDLKEHLELIVVGIVLITTAPVLIKLFFGKTAEKKK